MTGATGPAVPAIRAVATESAPGPCHGTVTVSGAVSDVVEAFLRSLKATTRRARDADLRDFGRFCQLPPRLACAVLVGLSHGAANAMAHAYRVHLEARRLAPATVARRLSSLRAVIALARRFGAIDWDLDVDAPPAVEPYRDTRGPGDDGWERVRRLLTAEAQAGSPRAVRDRAIAIVAHDLGLRVGELVGLDLEHVERDPSGLPVGLWILGKGRGSRERLTLPLSCGAALAAWLAIRSDAPGPIFHRLDRGLAPSGRLTTRSIERLIDALGRRAGLARKLRPHGLRHHAITRALDVTGGDVRRVRAFSRHARVETLMCYDDARRDDAGSIARLVSGE